MGIIFDTSEIIALERNRQKIEEIIQGREDDSFGISVVTAAELLRGVEGRMPIAIPDKSNSRFAITRG